MLAEDHFLVREGTRQLLSQTGGFTVVAEAETVSETLDGCRRLHPEVLLADMRLRDETAVTVIKQLRKEDLAIRILVLTAFDDEDYLFPALSAGADGYVLKGSSSTVLIEALAKVAEGDMAVDPALTNRVLQRMRKPRDTDSGESTLTERELQVLTALRRGASNRDIAQALSISAFTVQVHLRNIFGKFHVSNRTEAVTYALAHRLVSLDHRPA